MHGRNLQWRNLQTRTRLCAVGGNGHFCPAAPIRRPPKDILTLLHNSCGSKRPKTTLKYSRGSLMLGTFAQDLKCPVQPPSLVLLGNVCSLELHGIVRCPLGLNNARFTHRTNIAYFLEPEMQMSLHQTFLFCLLIDVPWWKRVFIWFLSMGFNLYCAFTVLSSPRGRTYGNTQNHRKSPFSSVLGS